MKKKNQESVENENQTPATASGGEGERLKIELLKLKDLKRAEYNPRKNTKEQQEQLRKSLTKFGCVEPIIVNKNKDRENIIVGGHFRVQELLKMGREEAECVIVDLNKDDEKELNLRLNANTGGWDYELLYKNFSYSMLNEVGFDFDKMEMEAGKLIEKYEELKKEEEDGEQEEIEWKPENTRNIKPGDVFILKNDKTEHRLICGDSLDQANLDKLMQGRKAGMVFTDPPYNVNISTRFNGRSRNTELTIANDNMPEEEFLEFLKKSFEILKNNSTVEAHNYICCNMKCIIPFKQTGEQFWDKDRATIFIWIKDLPGLGWGYREQYELILFYTNQESIKFYDKAETNVWEAPKSSSFKFRNVESDNLTDAVNRLHPTIKPTSIIARAIKNSAIDENDLILDIFGGSGSTLIAAERMKRTCYMSELDPFYCNVIIDRWEKLTGKKAVREEETKQPEEIKENG